MSIFGSIVMSDGGLSDVQNPRMWVNDWAGGAVSASREPVSPNSSLGLSSFYACLRNISEDVAKLPLITYRRLERGKQRATDHPIYFMLHDQPNPDMTSMAFRECMTAHAIGWHGAFAEIVRNGAGRAVALYPIHPSRVEIDRDEQLNVIYKVHSGDIDDRVKAVELPGRDVLHVHGLGWDGVNGYTLSRLAVETIGTGLAESRFAGAFFGNGTHASGILKHPGKLENKETIQRLREQWNEVHGGGAQNAHKLIITQEGMDFVPTTVDPEKAQMIESRQFTVEDVARWFRMPPHKIQHLLRSTFSNIEAQSIEYVTDTLGPWMVRWEQEISRKLFTASERREYFSEHLVLGLLRGDQAARATYYNQMFQIGAMSQNEIRERENLNPVEGGDVHWVPLNMQPSDPAARRDDQNNGPDDEPDAPTPPPDGNRQATRATAMILDRSLSLFCAKSRNGLTKAIERHLPDDPEKFDDWAQRFFAAHGEQMRDDLASAMAAVGTMLGPMMDVSARSWGASLGLELCGDLYGRVMAAEHDIEELAAIAESVTDSGPLARRFMEEIGAGDG